MSMPIDLAPKRVHTVREDGILAKARYIETV